MFSIVLMWSRSAVGPLDGGQQQSAAEWLQRQGIGASSAQKNQVSKAISRAEFAIESTFEAPNCFTGSAGFIYCPQKNHGVLPDKMQAT